VILDRGKGDKGNSMKNRPFPERMKFALSGLAAAWHRERSFRTQVLVACLAILVLALLRPPAVWWAIVALTIIAVLAIELMNSALEALIDHLHPSQHAEIRIIKDIAAGSVLIASLGALAVGFLLLLAVF
jgi:undecaprenol kinase